MIKGPLHSVQENPSVLVYQKHPVNNASKEMTVGYLMIICQTSFKDAQPKILKSKTGLGDM